MGKCSIGFEQARTVNHKNDAHHADNDRLTFIWTINVVSENSARHSSDRRCVDNSIV